MDGKRPKRAKLIAKRELYETKLSAFYAQKVTDLKIVKNGKQQ